MKLCSTHFDALRSALIDRGLGALMLDPDDPDIDDQVAHRLAGIRQFGVTLDTFEPTLLAQLELLPLLVNLFGVRAVIGLQERGGCQICAMTDFHLQHCRDPRCSVLTFDHVIYYVADHQLATWKGLRP